MIYQTCCVKLLINQEDIAPVTDVLCHVLCTILCALTRHTCKRYDWIYFRDAVVTGYVILL